MHHRQGCGCCIGVFCIIGDIGTIGDDAGGVLGTGVDAEVDAKVGADVDSDIRIDTGVGVDTCASVGVDIDFEAIADVSESNYIKHRTNQKVKRTH